MVVKRSLVKDTSEDTVLLLPHKKLHAMLGDEKSGLKLSQRTAYGVGHVLNDICSALWFSYTLLFFEVVLEMPSAYAGSLIFIGQLADTVASPIIGVLVDRYGTRKSWHMLGTALIAFSFSPIFSKCPWGPNSTLPGYDAFEKGHSPWEAASKTVIFLTVFYYAVIVTIFQTGWATVQIAHLAIIPDLTPDKCERANLTAIRYTATVCSSVFMYLVTWFVLHVSQGKVDSLGPSDSYKFKDVVLIGLLTGGTFTLLFHAVLNTPIDSKNISSKTKQNWLVVVKSYFKAWPLYQVTFVYFSSRMILNISLVYMPLYLVENLGNKAEYIATVPLVSQIASFLASLSVRQVRSFLDNKTSYVIGSLLSMGACVWIGVGLLHTGELFGAAVLLGAGSSVTGVASLCLCADLIGTDTENGAFVYSVVTAVDKLLGGIVVILIENLKERVSVTSPHYYQNVLAYGCGVFSIVGLIIVVTMYLNSNKSLKDHLPEEPS